MSYCKLGEIPTVKYKFANSVEKTYKGERSPIDVVTSSNGQDFTGGQCYHVSYALTIEQINTSFNPPRNVQELPNFFGPIGGIRYRKQSNGDISAEVLCHGRSTGGYGASGPTTEIYWQQFGGFSGSTAAGAESITILSTRREDGLIDNCGNDDYCEINIKSNGLVIFKDSGKCPCTFSVTCGDCPENTIRCDQPRYPGYCCLPCPPITQRINSMIARLN